MKVVRATSRLVEFKPTTLRDYDILKEFPGLSNQEGKYYCRAKGPVVRNLLERLGTYQGITLTIEDSAKEFLTIGKLKELPPEFRFKTNPLAHQIIALRFLYTNEGGGLLLDPGLGKTKVCLDYMALGGFQRILVICPKPLLFVWEEEVGTHRPELTYHAFESTDWDVEYEQAKDKRLWVMNYRKASLLLHKLCDFKFDALFIDEGLVKNHTSDQTKSITTLTNIAPIRVIMSGTLVNNTEADVYSPVRIMEPTLVGGSFAKFRDTYFNVWTPSKEKKHLKVVSGAKDAEVIKRILHSCSLVMRKEKWLNLPPKTFHYVNVKLPASTLDLYYEFLRNYSLVLKDKVIEADNPLSLMAKLSQFGNGFLYLDDPKSEHDAGDLFLGTMKKRRKKSRETHFFKDQPKLDALRNLLANDLAQKKFILWYTMDAERTLIEGLLKEMQISFVTVAGGEKDIRGKVRSFNADATLQVLVCQAKTLNYGVTVLGKQNSEEDEEACLFKISPEVCTEVFYSLTYSLEVFLQQQDRIHRIGQTHACSYYILVSNTPTELKLVEAIENKQVLREMMLEDWIHTIRDSLLGRV